MSDATDGLDLKTRRQLLAAAGGVAAVGLAGCTGEESGEGGGEDNGVPSRPSGEGINLDQLDPVVTFLVLSNDYQNAMLEREWGGG